MNAEPFLKAIDGALPSGVGLRNEPAFQAIERLMAPAARSDRTNDNGEISLSANVEWDDIVSQCEALSETGRDLRLLVIVARAWSNMDGFSGLAKGLELITSNLDGFWDSIHPELRDRPDPSDATLRRKNAVMQLDNDDNGLLGDLEMMVVLNPRGIGPVRGEDLAIAGISEFEFMKDAAGGLSDDEEAGLKARFATITTRAKTACRAMAAEAPEELANLADSIATADQARQALEQTFNEKAGLAAGTDCRLKELETLLTRASTTVQAAVADGGDGETAREPEMPETATPSSPEGAAAAPMAIGAAIPDKINSRRDVELCLEMIIDFYERTEPSSPIPHLARRMRRMVPMDFLQLMEEIAPSGMKEVKNATGVDDERKSE